MLVNRLQGEATRVAKWVLRPWRRRTRAHALILLYHRIARPGSDPWKLCVTPENFRGQLRALQRHCEFVPLTAIPGCLAAGRPAGRTPVAITFDDGYVDNLRNALPILRAFDAPATVFLATGWIGNPQGFWWERLASIVLESSRLPAEIDLPIGTRNFTWRRGAQDEQRQRAKLHRDLWQRCQSLPEDQRETTLAHLERLFGVVSMQDSEARPMRPDEVREMHASGLMSIGAHARTHRPLPALSEAEQASEISGSMQDCRDLTGVAPTCFAYPHGEVAEVTPQLVERAGFDLACSTVEELVWPGRNPYLLPRVSVGDLDAKRFERWLRSVWLQ